MNDDEFAELIEASPLGTPGAKALRARTDPAVTEEILRRHAWANHQQVAKSLTHIYRGHDITPVRSGFHVKDLEPFRPGVPRCVHVMKMLVNHRIIRTIGECDSTSSSYDRGWCYEGTGFDTLMLATSMALAWDGGDDSEPSGWIKRAL